MVKSGLTIHPSILTPIEQVNLVKCGLTKHILAVSQSYQSSASFSAPYFWSELTFNQKQNNSARNDSVQKWQAKELPSLQVNRSPKPVNYGLTNRREPLLSDEMVGTLPGRIASTKCSLYYICIYRIKCVRDKMETFLFPVIVNP